MKKKNKFIFENDEKLDNLIKIAVEKDKSHFNNILNAVNIDKYKKNRYKFLIIFNLKLFFVYFSKLIFSIIFFALIFYSSYNLIENIQNSFLLFNKFLNSYHNIINLELIKNILWIIIANLSNLDKITLLMNAVLLIIVYFIFVLKYSLNNIKLRIIY